MNKSITIKNLDKNLVDRLKFEAKKQGVDISVYIVTLLKKSLGFQKKSRQEDDKNDLSQQAGTWTQKEYEDFLKNISPFNKIDDELWQ